jgi:hypothetical protein
MEDLKNIIESSVSSIFTKQDVLKLIEEAMERQKQNPGNLISSENYENLQDRFEHLLNRSDSLVEVESAEFHMNDNTIVLDRVDLDTDSVVSLLRDAMDNTFIITENFL